MGDQLLIRAYNVGCGDCIYVRIPNDDDGFHILIDCGKKGGDELLKEAVDHLTVTALPDGDAPGKKRLDLIVATHRHEDHIKGFDPAWFKDIQVRNIWLSAVMDPHHPQAAGARKLHDVAARAMSLISERGLASSPQLELLAALYGVKNDVADDLLMRKLPDANGIRPRFVHSGMSAEELGLKDGDPVIHVLAPERDIDRYYLGKDTGTSLKALDGTTAAIAADSRALADGAPKNISASDFRLLQSRLLSNGLAFAAKDTSIQNNVSVVLLIEWRGRRLLFVGDAEWHGEFQEGKQNGSWNVMWEKHRDTHLSVPIDFLKIGHHGSVNATPPPRFKPREDGIPGLSAVLDTLLPVPAAGEEPTARAIVSTEREFYATIPSCELLADLGRRVSTRRNYGESLAAKGIDPRTIWDSKKAKRDTFFESFEERFLAELQPWRTDLEQELTGRGFIDVLIEPKD